MEEAQARFAQIKWKRALELRKQGNFAEAEAELIEGLSDAPDDLLLKAGLAQLSVRQGRLERARQLAEEILRQDPENGPGLTVMGDLLFKSKSFDQALNHFRQARWKDDRPYLAVRIARTLREMGRNEEGAAELDGALIGSPNDPALLKERAVLANRMQDPSLALDLYERLQALSPGDSFVAKEIMRIKSLAYPGEEVVEELEMVTRLTPKGDDPHIQGLLGQKLREVGRVEEAAAAFRTAHELAPHDVYFLKQEGFCYRRLGDGQRAVRCLSEAFLQDPGDMHVRASLAKLYEDQGRLEDYLSLLEQAARRHPENMKLLGPIKKIRKRIAEKRLEKNLS